MDSTQVATAVKLWASMHKDYINFENIDESGYCITLSVSAQKHQFQIFCQQDSWKPMFVVSEDPALNDWVTTINKYIQMFSNGVNIEQFVAELEKTLTKIFPKTAAVPTEPKVTVSAPSFKLPDNILPNVEVVSQSTADKIKPSLTVPGTTAANAAVGVTSENKPQEAEQINGKDMDSVRSQIMKWIGENTYVNVTLESINSSFQVEFSIGFPKIKFQILFTNEWKPMIIMSDSPFLSEYLAPANIMIEDRMQSGEPMQLSELMNMFALAYNEGQQQFQEQLNMDNKPMVDIEPNPAVNTEPIIGDPTDVVPPPPEPDVPPEIPTEHDWITTIFPSIRRHLENDNFQPWEVEEWVRRVDKARHASNDEGVRLIRSEILGGGPAPPEINKFIPKWRYLFGPNANANANNPTEEDPNNIRYKYNTKDGSEEATKRLIEEIQQLTALGDTKTSLGFVAKPIGKNLFQWSVILTGFKADSVLGQDLIEYSLKHRSQKSLDEGTVIEPSDIVFEVKFPADYPQSPPLFRLIRPRLIVPDNVDFGFTPSANANNNNNAPNTNQPTSNATTFSEFERQKAALNKGKHPLSMSIQIERHSSNAWNPQLHIVDLVKRIRNVLETGNIRVDNMMSTKEGLPTVGSFWKTYRCISSKNIGRGDADQGGKIFLPTSCVELLYGENEAPSWRGGFRHMDDGSDDEDSMDVDNVPNGPMVFEISSRSGKRSFVGVLEFTAPEGYVALPTWMMENLMVKESDPLQIRRVKLPRGQFLKLQPHSDKFYEVGNAKAMLEWVLRGFNALAVGDTIHVNHDNKEYKFDVLHVEPGQAIAITDSDLKVDFAEPLEGSKDTGKSSFATDKPKTNNNTGVSMSTELHRDGLLSSVEMNRYDDEEDKENKKKAAAKEAIGAASGRLETADTDVEGVNYKVCETCRQKIPMASYTMHSISCPRINWFCEKCHTVVKKTERQSHLDTAHAVVTCPDCHERVEQFQFEEHKKDKCQMRPVHCQYCELKIRFKDRWDHEKACGSVTELCEKCKRRVPRRELAVHESACDGSGVLSSSPSVSSGFTFGSPTTKFTPPPFQRKNSVYLCEKCQHPCEGFDELQVHMLTVHSDDNMVDIIPESFENKEEQQEEKEEKEKETMQM